MNLAILERMVREGDLSADALRYLIGCRGECEWLDYKHSLPLNNDKALCDFTRDVVAMKNVGGGYIVVGVADGTWEPIGLPERLPYDGKLLRDQIQKASGLYLDVDIVQHDIVLGGPRRLFALIYARASKKRTKRRTPSLINNDFRPKEAFGLRRGDIYVRRGDSTVKLQSEAELQELLDDLEAQANQDSITTREHPSPFAIQDGTYRLLEKGFESFVGRISLRQEVFAAVTRDPRIWIINVHGPGGVGKSALVNWVAHEFYRTREFESIIQLTAKETVLLDTGIKRWSSRSLYSLENLLDHVISTFEETPPDNLDSRKALAYDLLCAWNTLLVLDNMETVSDGRILTFVQGIPASSKSKVLLTSRQKTGGWELSIPVVEFTDQEIRDFLKAKSEELRVPLSVDSSLVDRVRRASGGLPLAIQWILGQYKLVGDMPRALDAVGRQDSPILEFSFRNVWNILSSDSRAILAILTIFDEPPTTQQLTIATEWSSERVETALGELADATMITPVTHVSDGRVTFSALPITLTFARHQLGSMGEFEVTCRRRMQQFNEQLALRDSEIHRFVSLFERYGLNSDNEKRAAILCRRAESEMFAGNVDNAEVLFRQARDLAPQSAYVHALGASYELARNRVGAALDLALEACRRATKKTGALCYTIMARILDVQRDRTGRVEALKTAIQFSPDDVVIRHQYGVALSRAGRTEDAILEFSSIIEDEKRRSPLRDTLLFALKTRIINLRRLGRSAEAKDDVDLGRRIVRENPHLQRVGMNLDELSEDE